MTSIPPQYGIRFSWSSSVGLQQLPPERQPPAGREVTSLPVAGRIIDSEKPLYYFTGADTILGERLSERDDETFTLRAEQRVKRLDHSSGRVRGAHIEDLRSGKSYFIHAERVLVCAGTILTLQLLHNSAIGRDLPAFRYLMEHPMSFCQVVLGTDLVRSIEDYLFESRSEVVPEGEVPIPHDDPPPMIWIPFAENGSGTARFTATHSVSVPFHLRSTTGLSLT